MILIPLQTMLRAEQYKDWESAAQCLFKLSRFLLGYGQGLKIPPPPQCADSFSGNHIRARMTLVNQRSFDTRNYYQKYSPDIMERIGMYISDIMAKLQKQNNPYMNWDDKE